MQGSQSVPSGECSIDKDQEIIEPTKKKLTDYSKVWEKGRLEGMKL